VDDHDLSSNPFNEDDNKPVTLPSSEEQGTVAVISPEPGEKPRTRSFALPIVIVVAVIACCLILGVLFIFSTPNTTALFNPVAPTPVPSMTPAPTITYTSTITFMPPTQATSTLIPLPTILPISGCIPWNQVSKADEGKNICVTGVIIQKTYIPDPEYINVSYFFYQFTKTDPNAFQFTMGRVAYVVLSILECVNVTGDVIRNGKIIYMKYPNISKCNP
jgi:hypothetical protein